MNKFWFVTTLVAFIGLRPIASSAHPVSFEGGTMVMGSYTSDRLENELNYTFSPSSSVGLTEYRIKDDAESKNFLIPRLGTRFRENSLDSQANLYLSAGLGAQTDHSEEALTGLAAIQADWETRRLYTLGLVETLQSPGGENLTYFRYRAGIAPYKADFDEVSAWIIGQVDYSPYKDTDKVGVTPVLRVFYKNYLVEAGSDFKGNVFLAWMASF